MRKRIPLKYFILALAFFGVSSSFAGPDCASCAVDPEPTLKVAGKDEYRVDAIGLTGTLVRPIVGSIDCRRLRVFFPGHAHELGYKGDVPADEEESWAKYLLGPGHYHLGPEIVKSGCPVLILGDSVKTLGADDLSKLLLRLSLDEFEVISHSGGNVGLNASLSDWPPELVKKITAVKLLDNFYGEALAKTLSMKFDPARLSRICSGFLTGQNQVRFDSYYRQICPKVVKKGDHKAPVAGYFSDPSV